MKTIETLTWYLEMKSKPALGVPLPEGFTVAQYLQPEVKDYLSIYKAVGGKYHWYDRLLMNEDDLNAILHHENTSVWFLKYNGQTAGFVEFNYCGNETEIVYFGLCENFTGRKAGFPFLCWAIEHAWQEPITRLWLHTCDLDHPAALPLYQKAGFVVYKTETIVQPILTDGN
ncbi:MAG: GNAT family N-acetyltransferase [Omnitrophica WOR_2 bacterium]|jgi:GNAT superfamily N-acetyltransferase